LRQAAGFLSFWGRKSSSWLRGVHRGLDGFGPDIREPPTDGSPGAKIKFKLDGTFQIFNPAFGVCVEPHWGIPRQTVGLLR
jgi:hypothetical protein